MLQPFKIDFYVYADSQEEAAQLSNVWKNFVNEKRSQGIAISVDKITKALSVFGNNPLLLNYLK